MEKRAFINRLRSLSNVDGDLLPELTRQQRLRFLHDPVGFLLGADDRCSDAIMREIEARQTMSADKLTVSAVEKRSRTRKRKPGMNGQRELLLPIIGGMTTNEPAEQSKPAAKKKAG